MRRGEVWLADLTPRSGSEQRGRRPVVVLSHDGFNSNPAKRAAVAGLQGALKIKGFEDDNSTSPDKIDGKFGRGTERATKAFQTSVGMVATGKGDKATRAKADEPT